MPGLSPVSTSKNKQFGIYIQDDWAVNDKLTLNLGVRWDYEDITGVPQLRDAGQRRRRAQQRPDPNAPGGQTYAQTLALGGVNVNDYISNGHNRSAQKNEWQPRLGFSYDLNGDEQHVVFGGAGRAYDRDLFDYLQLEQTKTALPEPTIYFRSASRRLPYQQHAVHRLGSEVSRRPREPAAAGRRQQRRPGSRYVQQ